VLTEAFHSAQESIEAAGEAKQHGGVPPRVPRLGAYRLMCPVYELQESLVGAELRAALELQQLLIRV
jgi:hypothetical protein